MSKGRQGRTSAGLCVTRSHVAEAEPLRGQVHRMFERTPGPTMSHVLTAEPLRGQGCCMFPMPNLCGTEVVACSQGCQGRTSPGPSAAHVPKGYAEPPGERIACSLCRTSIRSNASHVSSEECQSRTSAGPSVSHVPDAEPLRNRVCRMFPMLNLCGAERNGRFPMPKSCQAECLARSKRR